LMDTQVTTKLRFPYKTKKKPLSFVLLVPMLIEECLLACVMHHPLFKDV